MTQEELLARAEDLIAAWNQGDIDRIVSAFAAETREAGRTDAEGLLERFPDLELEVLRMMPAGNVITTEWVARTRTAGQTAEHAGVIVADYDSRGRIAHYSRYWR